METSSRGRNCRCIFIWLVIWILICFSSFQFDWSTSTESTTIQSRAGPGGPCLDNSELVSSNHGNVNRQSTYTQSSEGHIDNFTVKSNSSTCKQATFDGMSYIRKSFENRELSKESVDIIMASWRHSTQKQYSTYINRWVSFCDKRKINSFHTNIDSVIEFLTELFHSGKSYETLNTASSALSSLCKLQDGYSVRSHPTVVRYMTGIFNLRPRKPKYN